MPRSSAHSVARAGGADDGVEDDIGLDLLEELDRVAADLRERRDAVERRGARRRSNELEIGVPIDHVPRLEPDRARGAEDRNALHRPHHAAPRPNK